MLFEEAEQFHDNVLFYYTVLLVLHICQADKSPAEVIVEKLPPIFYLFKATQNKCPVYLQIYMIRLLFKKFLN
ncbi:hypothetical protein AAAC51_16855 [Priestia megaterium]